MGKAPSGNLISLVVDATVALDKLGEQIPKLKLHALLVSALFQFLWFLMENG